MLHPKRPHFSSRTAWDLSENRLASALNLVQATRIEIIDLTISNPTACQFRYDAPAIASALVNADIVCYRPDPQGLRSAREAVAAYYASLQSQISPDDLVLTSGTSEAYSHVFRLLCNPGDEVLIPSPGYPLFDFLADLCDVKLVRYPLLYDHGWQMDFSALAAADTGRTRAIIVVHPNNPTGHYTSPPEQDHLREFCLQRGIALIADEVFLDFPAIVTSSRTFSASSELLTFTLSGISKICGLPQMKLGWIAVCGPAAEKRIALQRLEVIADAYLSPGTPAQLALPKFLDCRIDFQRQVIARVQANLRELDRQLAQQSVCTRLDCQGGWSAVLRVPVLLPDEDLAIELLEKKHVHVHPGHFYDFSRSGALVISLIVPEEQFAEGARRVLSFFRE
jgi:alanine-synthesizing transaminase